MCSLSLGHHPDGCAGLHHQQESAPGIKAYKCVVVEVMQSKIVLTSHNRTQIALQDNEVDEGNSSASSDDDVQISWRGLDTAEKAPNSQRCEEQFNTAKISPEDAWWRRDQQRQALSRVTEENTQQTSIRTSATSSRPIISSQRRTATQPYRPQLQSIKQVQACLQRLGWCHTQHVQFPCLSAMA